MKKIAFIGCGNMGGAIVRAVCKKLGGESVYVANRSMGKAQALAEECGCTVCPDNRSAAKDADFIFLGVKPYQILDMIGEVNEVLTGREIIVSMAAGVTIANMSAVADKGNPIVRILPNTPCAIGKGVVSIVPGEGVEPEKVAELENMLSECGYVGYTDEAHAEASMTVGGCTTAYTYMFIEALSDGGVKAGLPRAEAMRLAAQAVAGAAEMLLQSGSHPGALKDAVCSPGGATIEGVQALESRAFRGAVMDAIYVAAKRSGELG